MPNRLPSPGRERLLKFGPIGMIFHQSRIVRGFGQNAAGAINDRHAGAGFRAIHASPVRASSAIVSRIWADALAARFRRETRLIVGGTDVIAAKNAAEEYRSTASKNAEQTGRDRSARASRTV